MHLPRRQQLTNHVFLDDVAQVPSRWEMYHSIRSQMIHDESYCHPYFTAADSSSPEVDCKCHFHPTVEHDWDQTTAADIEYIQQFLCMFHLLVGDVSGGSQLHSFGS